MRRSIDRSAKQFVFTLVLFAFAAALGSVFAGCGYAYTSLSSNSKMGAIDLFKDLNCNLHMRVSQSTGERMLKLADEILCGDSAFFVGSASDPDVLDTLEMLRMRGDSVYQVQVTGREAIELLKFQEGLMEVRVLEISSIVVKVEASFF